MLGETGYCWCESCGRVVELARPVPSYWVCRECLERYRV